ncbi:helix-turn-helix domain-containing protein [Paenibacillus whitsoniae]|uniref:Helix-turn-helix domain-containing protein n=1 Tax=Paenibacillus whitsoniae TaxID=2496558 RepID=A0A430J9K2_9BACL|nr:helix-turn-helix domain-containing protein [Paenibacillus whitsoniae]RTE07159.1 helix-turn-helix domain-containing protein [Paenibacillus whitsoniae]
MSKVEVVIAEDELWIRSMIGEMVEKLGPEFHVVCEVGNGEDAWSYIEESWPSIVITDIMMPRKNGLWLAEQIATQELPIISIIVSGYDNFQYAKQAMRFGISEYVLKPVNEEELHDALRRSVQRLAGLSDTRQTIARIQKFAETLPDLAQTEVQQAIDHVVNETYRLKVPGHVRSKLLNALSNQMNAFLHGIDSGYPVRPLEAGTEAEVRRHFQGLIASWIDLYPKYANQHVRMAIRKVCEHLDEHYAKTYSLPEAAEMAHLSVSHFSSLFKKSTGLTYLNYVNQLRIEKAKEELLAPEVKIYEVAAAVGFASLPYFNRIFKQLTGVTPQEYRKRLGI